MTAEVLFEDAMEFSAGLGEIYSCLHNLVKNIRESLCIDLCIDSSSVGLPMLKQRIDPEMGVEDPGKQYRAIENLQILGFSFVQLAVMLCPGVLIW